MEIVSPFTFYFSLKTKDEKIYCFLFCSYTTFRCLHSAAEKAEKLLKDFFFFLRVILVLTACVVTWITFKELFQFKLSSFFKILLCLNIIVREGLNRKKIFLIKFIKIVQKIAVSLFKWNMTMFILSKNTSQFVTIVVTLFYMQIATCST